MVGRETIKRTQDHRVADECSLPPGTVLGRYVIVRFIGGGGNADVYAAYDQLLQRTVALKILRGLGDAGQWETVLEEAQSLARLSHPNVVVVHDVGRQDEHVFISMELIDGDDLGTWLGGRKHRWRDIVSVFVAAGRGLAAAHEHGVVHGDFKPTNVLVDAAGRVRVVDFGLAAIDGSDGAGADPTDRKSVV